MKRLLIALALVGCGSDDSDTPQEPRIRPVSLYMVPDVHIDLSTGGSCSSPCQVAEHDNNNYVCLQGYWVRLADMMGPGEVLYCRF